MNKKHIKIIIYIMLLCFSLNSIGSLIQFQPQQAIKASEINNNFSHVKSILETRNINVNFSHFTTGQVIQRSSLESEFDKVRDLNISIAPLDLLEIKSEELNNAFSQMENGAYVADDIPLANNMSFSISEDSQYIGNFDIENEIGSTTIQIVQQPSNGTIIQGINNSFTYIPNSNYNGSDSIVYKVFDGNNYSSNATISISISPVNDAPTTIFSSFSTNEDVTFIGSLNANDIESNPITYSVVSQGTKGIVTITNSTTGAFTYVPNTNQNGSDSFTFKVNDGNLDSNISTVSVSISAINDEPIAQNSSFNTNEDTTYSGILSASDIDGSPLTYSIVSQGTKGTVAITNTATGAFNYVPQSNINGTDSFTFRVNDGTFNSTTATVSVTINSVNDAPVANSQSGLTITDEQQLSITLTGSDIEGDNLTYSIVVAPAKGTLIGTPPNLTYRPTLNSTGADSFTFRINDGTTNSLNGTVSLTINPVWPSGTLSALNVTSGTTTLTAGQTFAYSSINIAAGATLNISGSSNLITVIGATGSIVINGNVTVTNTALGTSTASVTTPDGSSLSYTQNRKSGGSGGRGGSIGSSSCNLGANGGSQSNGRGGGGGGGSASGGCGQLALVGSSSSTDSTLSTGGNGTTGGDDNPGQGGAGGGNPGGRAAHGGGRGGGGGGGGGYIGRHGLALFIKSKTSITGSGLINLRGLSGFNGGAGGVSNGCLTCSNQGGGGGGGGSGGSGGNLWVVSPVFSVSYDISGGPGGIGGAGGGTTPSCNGVNSCNGQNGSPGDNGSFIQAIYPSY